MMICRHVINWNTEFANSSALRNAQQVSLVQGGPHERRQRHREVIPSTGSQHLNDDQLKPSLACFKVLLSDEAMQGQSIKRSFALQQTLEHGFINKMVSSMKWTINYAE